MNRMLIGLKLRLLAVMVLLICFCGSGFHNTAQAQGDVTAEQIEAILAMLKEKGVISDKEAETIRKRQPQAGTPAAKSESSEESVQPRESRTVEQIEKSLEEKILDVRTDARLNQRAIERLEQERVNPLLDFIREADWVKRISLGGDLRLRYQTEYFDDLNGAFLQPDNPTELMNSTEDRERFRYRLRLNLDAKLLDPCTVNLGKVDMGLRVTTGNDEDPLSTNETLGDYYNRDTVTLDRCYLQWRFKPVSPVWGRIPQITLTGGRIPNPWFSKEMVWDEDLNFEGIALGLRTDTQSENGWNIFLTGGAFPLQEVELSSKDKWLYAGQIGVEAEPSYGVGVKVATAYYDFRHIAGEVNDPLEPGLNDFTAPIYQQKGNTLIDIDPSSDILTALAADFQVVDLTGEIDLSFFHPVHVILSGTYIKNIGFDQDDVSERTGIEDIDVQNEGYRAGMQVGHPVIEQLGDWNVSFNYRYLEADAMVDAFTDSDFHLGGTNCRGWVADMEYGLYKNIWFRIRWLTADEIEGQPLAIDVLQLDINARF